MNAHPDSLATPTLVSHPLIASKLTRLRAASTPTGEFRALMGEIAALMAFRVTFDLETEPVEVATPLDSFAGARLARRVALVPILRAGMGMLDGFLKVLPDAAVGHIGMFRDEATLLPESYYWKMPPAVNSSDVIVLDPMLATGGSAVAALSKLKENGATRLRYACVLACPEGLREIAGAHPDVPVFTAAVDEGLNERGYIVPGLGDAGDRYFGTV